MLLKALGIEQLMDTHHTGETQRTYRACTTYEAIVPSRNVAANRNRKKVTSDRRS
jgi:hypothetical protein